MKIQCNACEAAEATVLCCADEAALCWACDEKVHAANKLASKHRRVPLLSGGSSSHMPKCDICQEAAPYFFCLEDRSLLCRKCDVAKHTANSYVSAHQRFLLTGVQVGLEPIKPVGSQSSAGSIADSPCKSLSKGSISMQSSGELNDVFSNQVAKDKGLSASNMPFSGASITGSMAVGPFDEIFGLTDFNHIYGFTEHGSSKTDSAKLGSSWGSPVHLSAIEGLDVNDYLEQVPEIQWAVPEIHYPPTTSGLHGQRSSQYLAAETSVFVPDICSFQNPQRYQAKPVPPKCHRQFR